MENLRNAALNDLSAISAIENVCFPPNEAASVLSFTKRLQIYPQHFWLLEIDGQLVGYVNGMVTNQPTISDELFSNAALHDELGEWQSIFGIAVAPGYRNQGYASQLMRHLIIKAKEEKRKGVILTCKSHLITYYQRFGFTDMGVSQSVHGGEVWHDMTLTF
ncbi:acetyltransferase (GNAT) family protein [Mucilaginibacter yixingensis]|uniref:Acetyltransferase (GNAT) family protein n=1 Tax=Mucilaginibacter yixingensis TaxID=1295612 RepID=A0A2T5JAF1_9SPHI|nr:GNAT family N-acetyltransferase [Mucilaginibacter yixingensis]PTQ97852.1 acetyltransferase (GNAT) family protein [Mucilaginibacter yixingensis]